MTKSAFQNSSDECNPQRSEACDAVVTNRTLTSLGELDVCFEPLRQQIGTVLTSHYSLHPDLVELTIDAAIKLAIDYPRLAQTMNTLVEQALATTIRHKVFHTNTLKDNTAQVLGGLRLDEALCPKEYNRFHDQLRVASMIVVSALCKKERCRRHQ